MRKSAGAFIIHNNKLLMLLRDNNPHISDPDCWQLIGGQSEEGETSMEALIREIKEEINLQITKEEVTEIGKIIVPQKQEYSLFWIKLVEDQIKDIKLGDEGQKVDFLSVSELAKAKMGTNLSNYFREYKNGLRNIIENGILDKKALGFDENGIHYIQ